MISDVGIVVIGRNEGERLHRALSAVRHLGVPVVYVDSGSTDGSPDAAALLSVPVVRLDARTPYTAARARNAGFRRVRESAPHLAFVQFVDGDCELMAEWLARGHAELRTRPELGAVSGRVQEIAPHATIYQRLCQIEWNALGADGFGGNVLLRATALEQVGGFDPRIVAGEDTELGARLRAGGWGTAHLDAPMVRHDAAMQRFGQWWRRALRAGYAYAQCSGRVGRDAPRVFGRQYRSAWLWGAVLPLAALACAGPTRGGALLLLGVYALPAWRAYASARRRGEPARHAGLYAAHCVAAKLPQFLGIAKYHWTRLQRRPDRLIEHKTNPKGEPRRRAGAPVLSNPRATRETIS